MGLTKLRTWVLGAVLLAVVLIAGLWLLLLSPTLEAAASVRAEAESTAAANEVRATGLAALIAQSQNLPQMRADLQSLQAAVPASAQIPDFFRQLQETATAHQVALESVQIQTPAEATVAGTTTAEPSAGATASTTTTATGLVVIPVTITAAGDRANLDAFLSDVQSTMARLVVVTGVNEARSDTEGDAAYTDQISGNLLVLPDASAAVTPEPTPTATATP